MIVAIFVLHQAAQLAVTPLNEGMDFGGHLAYVAFVAEHGRPPLPDEPSFPAWIDHLLTAVPGPDFTDGTRYQAWAQLSAGERATKLERVLTPGDNNVPYVGSNYESQQPPLYYWLLSAPFRLSGQLPLDVRTYLLGLVSVALAAAAMPAIHGTLRLYVDEPSAALATLAVTWFPNLLAFLGRITNDDLAFPVVAWAVYFMARPYRTLQTLVGTGVLVGLAVLTKSYALTLVPAYVVSSSLVRNPSGRLAVDARRALIAAGCACAAVGPLLAVNLLVSGQPVLLNEMRSTGDLPLEQRLLSVARLDWLWFGQGLVQGFWWSGYFSFVVRGFYDLPLLVVVGLLLVGLSRPRRLWSSAREAGVHLLAIVCFVGGLAWHAGLTTLQAAHFGQSTHGGSEGWYLDVLVGSVVVVGLLLLCAWIRGPQLHMLLAVVAIFLVVWNLLGRMLLLVFWSGQVGPGGVLPAGLAGALRAALSSLPWSMERLASPLPGAIGPAVLTVCLPLLAALALTGLSVRIALSGQPAERAVGVASASAVSATGA